MIQGYNESIVTLPSNSAPVTLTTDCIRTRSTYNWLCHSQGSPIYKIKQGGRYRVSFNTNATSAATGIVALQDYLALKKYIISLCKDDVLELSEKVGLNEYDTKLLLSLNRDESRVATCMKFGCCEKKYTKDLRRIMEKIFNHFKRTSEN